MCARAAGRHRSLAVAIVLDVILLAIGLTVWQIAVNAGTVSAVLYGSPDRIWIMDTIEFTPTFQEYGGGRARST